MQRLLVKHWVLAIAYLLAAGGYVLQLWPLEMLGISVAVLAGHPIFALILSIFLDVVLYGNPTGPLHALMLPMTLFALISIGIRKLGMKYFIDTTTHETL